MAATPEILASYGLLVYGEDFVEGATNELQGKQIVDAAKGKDLDLDLDGKAIPTRRRRRVHERLRIPISEGGYHELESAPQRGDS